MLSCSFFVLEGPGQFTDTLPGARVGSRVVQYFKTRPGVSKGPLSVSLQNVAVLRGRRWSDGGVLT